MSRVEQQADILARIRHQAVDLGFGLHDVPM
jgi:hypothetical protein